MGFIRRILVLATVIPSLALSASATEVVINSKYGYRDVGPLNKELSRYCSLGHFNQRQIGHYTVQLHDKTGGAAVLGIAKSTGFNLRDPDHHAKLGEDYFFRNDGTSSCQVFVGGKPIEDGQKNDDAAKPAETKPADDDPSVLKPSTPNL